MIRIVIVFWIVLALTAIAVILASVIAVLSIRARPGWMIAVAFAWLALSAIFAWVIPEEHIAYSLEPETPPYSSITDTMATSVTDTMATDTISTSQSAETFALVTVTSPLDPVFQKLSARDKLAAIRAAEQQKESRRSP